MTQPVPASASGITILVIDDEEINTLLLRRVFDDFTVLTAPSGSKGLEVLATHPVDLVLLDVRMPVMDGFAVLQAIRFQTATADLPVILISSLTDTDSVVTGLELGANDYLFKPVNMHIARARVALQLRMKQLNDDNKRIIDELRSTTRLREQFFRIASHDLKSPLANLRLVIEEYHALLSDDGDLPTLKTVAEASLNTMQMLIEQFIDAAALQSGRMSLMIELVEVSLTFWEMTHQFCATARQKEITLHIEPTELRVMADAGRLAQVFANLVSNAIKYSPLGGTIVLWAEALDGAVRLCVSDEGEGVPEDERQYLFTEFGKLSSTTTQNETSTGLGLWVVRQMATLMGGEVGAYFPEAGGSVFWVVLPAA